jgi:hypothetical protein
MPGRDEPKPVRRVWVPQVAVDVDALEFRAKAFAAGHLDSVGRAQLEAVLAHLNKARNAAFRIDPLPRRLTNWWRGTLVESAYRHLHAAEVALVDLYGWQDLQAEIRGAVARAGTALNREDPRQRTVGDFREYTTPEELKPRLKSLMRDSFATLDARHAQLRSFRNILLMAALSITVLMIVTSYSVAKNPTVLPLCFPRSVISTNRGSVVTTESLLNCPTGGPVRGPTGGDILVVALLGLLGGALTAAISIRNLKGTTTPYDVPVALAMLKVPLGAFTAVLGLVAIRGDFVPGLSALDSQVQILAYALVFGFAQQALTRLLDQRAESLLSALPGKDVAEAVPMPPPTRMAAQAPAPSTTTQAPVPVPPPIPAPTLGPTPSAGTIGP